ncbi:MAG TPA: hypothetical protein VF881_18815 [Polyangiaceae bacterium]
MATTTEMRYAAGVGIVLGAASCSASAFAYRPFDSTDADVVKPGELEFEIGPVGYLRETDDRFLVVPALIANAGIFERWELVLEGRHRIRTEPVPGEARDELADTALSIKGLLREGSMQNGSGLSVATEVGALLPTTEPETGVGASATLILSERDDFGAAHLNGALFLSRTHRPGALAGLILEGPIAWPVRPVIEGLFQRESDVGAVATGLIGFIWRARDNLSFDGAIRGGRAFDMALVEVRAGLTWAFEL